MRNHPQAPSRRFVSFLPRLAGLVLSGLAVLSASGHAVAQAWPAKSVRVVAPYPAGVPPDIIARLFADKLAAMWGQGVFVENRPGAGGIPGMVNLVRSPADGYAIGFIAASTVTLTPHLFKDPQFNVDREVSIAALVGTSPMMITVNPAVPAQTLPDFIRYAKGQHGKINFAATLLNSLPHLTG